MRCFDDNPDLTWTFLFAHPDDELAIAGWIHHLVNSGARVWLCWAHATPERREEALDAADFLGVEEDHCRFGDLPDGQFISEMLQLDTWVNDIFEETSANRYVSMAFEQGHLDHDALHYAVHRWTGTRHFEFPLYWHYAARWQKIGVFADPKHEETWMLGEAQAILKRAMPRIYRSQTVARNVAGYEFLTKLMKGSSSLFEVERLRHVVRPDYSLPAHPEPARSKILASKPWKQWENAINQWVASAGDPNWT